MIGKTVSHYRILTKLGEGGMGVVYVAEDTRLKRKVALKVLPTEMARDPGRLERFQREAEAVAALNNPNIVTIHSVEEAGGIHFITMELVEGQNLHHVIPVDGFTLETFFDLALPLTDALSAAHDKGIIHRDLKPGNIIVGEDGRVKVLDFGLAKLRIEVLPGEETRLLSGELTGDGVVLGTVPYMSPEQVEGKEIDHRSDIFSLGIILFEMATGRRPFQGHSQAALTSSVLRDTPALLTDLKADLPRHLARIVAHCLEKEPDHRCQTAKELRNQLLNLRRELDSEKVLRSGSGTAVPARRKPWRLPIWAAATAVVVLMGFAVYQQLRHRGDGGQSPSEEVRSTQADAMGRKMLVVLPFENLGPPEDEYFADGITEELTARLAGGVEYVLEGTIRWQRISGGKSRVRVTPQLIRVTDATHVWADVYQEDMTDIFQVQSDIGSQVAQALDIVLLEPERKALAAEPTRNLDAYRAYLRGLDYRGRGIYSEETRRLEVQMYERAVELDPDFALAYAALSRAHANLLNLGMDRTPERLAMAKTAAERALALQPELPAAHLALGYYYYYGLRDYDQALVQFEIAAEALPHDNNTLQSFAWIRRRQGRWDEALLYAKRAFSLNPRDATLAREMGNINLAMRRYGEAEEYYDRSIALAPDQQAAFVLKAMKYWASAGDLITARSVLEAMPARTDPFTTYFWYWQELFERNYEQVLDRLASVPYELFEFAAVLVPKIALEGYVYSYMGEPELSRQAMLAALALLEKEVAARPEDARVHSALGNVLAVLGRKEEAIREGKQGVDLYPVSRDALHGPRHIQDLADIYVTVGEYDIALEQIEYLLSIPTFVSVELLKLHPLMDPLHDHPEFRRLEEQYARPGP
jgi:TolB-like protein/Tfp pilus assembly protein PilF